ncbi:hypothetical protein [Pimelobacter simplex]|uniref:hypothetical protein n=1 Tax=Nocardioides simplex TaxID=2045 RepID=UPI003AACC704
MPWNDPKTWLPNLVLTAAELNQYVRDNFKAIGDPWTAYTPAWTSSGTQPVLSNGSATGRYIQAGKLIIFRATITMGSTTTYGTGQYSVGIPTTSATGLQLLAGEALIGGAAYRLHCRIPSSSTAALLYCDPTTAGNAVRLVSGTVPGTFASTHSIFVQGVYEGA